MSREARRAAIRMIYDSGGLDYLDALKLIKLLNYGKARATK